MNAAAAFTQDEAYAAQTAAADAAEAAPVAPDPLGQFLAHAALESGENQAGPKAWTRSSS